MAHPAVSVIMAVYNGQQYLREAVESVLSQTLRDFELVIVDDGSQDASSEILVGYAEADPRVVVITQENQGLTRSLNTAVAAARGGLIARMDADDICFPERLEKQVAYLLANRDVVLVGTGVEQIDAAGRSLGPRRMEVDAAKLDAHHLNGATSLVHPSIVVRASSLNAVGGYSEEYETSQDLDLFLRLAELGTIANIPEPLLKYRWHDGNVSVRKIDQQDRDVTAIVAAAHRRRGLDPPSGVPLARWQFRRAMARKYGGNGDRRSAVRFATQAIRLRPWSLRSWYTLCRAAVC